MMMDRDDDGDKDGAKDGDHHDNNPDTVQIDEMEDTFDLVMVAEHWDESMVLLKDLLCWEFR